MNELPTHLDRHNPHTETTSMKVTRQQWAILSRQVNESAAYFAKLADRTTHSDLIHDGRLFELTHQANNAEKAFADLVKAKQKKSPGRPKAGQEKKGRVNPPTFNEPRDEGARTKAQAAG